VQPLSTTTLHKKEEGREKGEISMLMALIVGLIVFNNSKKFSNKTKIYIVRYVLACSNKLFFMYMLSFIFDFEYIIVKSILGT